jgi:hypothetical protein
MKSILPLIIVFLVSSSQLTFSEEAQSSTNNIGLCFYLVKNMSPQTSNWWKVSLDTVKIDERPFIRSENIISYSDTNHSLLLTKEAYERFKRIHTGEVFAACVNTKVIYVGMTWSGILSATCPGVAMLIDDRNFKANTVSLWAGYPNESYFDGPDPRSKPVIVEALRAEHKLEK